MKILHTSDWHLGRLLYGRKRYDEFSAFLDWLAETIVQERADALIVAGDIFDTTSPSNRAQALYYKFLCRVAASACRHVIVIAGNHDSPTFLNAPRELLRVLNVHVIGAVSENLDDEVLLLRDSNNLPEALVCAVPYLRDRDIRAVEAGESIEDKERKLIAGIRSHYSKVCELAEQQRQALNAAIPIIATGHLFTAGGQTIDGDGVRELYIGSLAQVTSAIFPNCIDYLALGHLHVPQKVHGSETMRYSGSPLAMSFGEAGQTKSICRVEFSQRKANISLINIPIFQPLERLQGSIIEISSRLLELASQHSQAWLEVIYTGEEISADLTKQFDELMIDASMEILRVKNNRVANSVLNRIQEDETLDDLNPIDVFERCLDEQQIPKEQRTELLTAYQEIIKSLQEEDIHGD